jgi:glycosyltransferase involved in cell wall biosynthesis
MKVLFEDSRQDHSSSIPRVTGVERSTVFLMANDLGIGGTQKQLVLLAQALKHGAFRVQLGCLQRQGYFAKRLSTEWDVAEFPLGGSFLSKQAIHSARSLARYIHAHQVRVAHAFSFYSNIVMIPIARMSGVPVVLGSQRQRGDLLTPLQFAIQAASFHMCDRIVCNSQAAAERLAPWGLSRKLVVIPNAVAPEIFRVGEMRTRLRVAGVARIGMIARMSAAKEHRLLLRAAVRLISRRPGTQFFLFGDGPQRSQLEALTRQMGLTREIRFLGEFGDDLGDALANLDISVLATSSESCPNALTESMAAGLPVVATRVGGVSELISHGETGLLVAPDDAVCLAGTLEYLIDNPQICDHLGRNGRKVALSHFRLEHVRDAYEQLYAELLDH